MGQDQDSGVARLNAFLVWMTNGLTQNMEQMLDWLERFMADPGMERMRPLFETFVGMFPKRQTYTEVCEWGVAKGNRLWVKARVSAGEVFIFNDMFVQGAALNYAVRENLIVVWDTVNSEFCATFWYDEHDERWERSDAKKGRSVLVVRNNSVVYDDSCGGPVEDKHTRFSFEAYPIACDPFTTQYHGNIRAGEDWLVAWSRVDTTLTVHLVSGEYRETMSVEYTVGDPTVFAPMTVEGVFVNVAFSVESIVLSEKWHKGTRLFCVKSMKGDAVVNAFCIDGNTWQWNRRAGQEPGGVITVNGKDLGIVYASGMEVKDSVVCVAYAFGGKPKSGDLTSVLPMLPDGKMTHLHTYFDRVGWREQFASWPVVLSNRGVLSAVLKTGDVLMVRDVLTCVDNAHRNGQHLFVQTRTERNRWTVMTYDMNTLEQTGNSLNGRSKFNLATAVVAADGALFAAMQRSEKWVVVIGPRGQYGHDYHEVRDIAVVDGFVTFIGRVDGKVVRVRVPL